MNYIKQLNAFYELLPTNPLSANSQCLYNVLLHINNKCNWKSEFTVANTLLIAYTSLNISALQRARNSLIQNGYIKYKKGTGNNAGIYTIVNFEQQIEQQTDNTTNNKPTTNRQQSEHINKLNKTKLNKTINKKEKSEYDVLIDTNFNNDNVKKAVYEFIKMRVAIKKPLTTRALELLISRLKNLSPYESEQIEILNNSILNNWQGIFPLKNVCVNTSQGLKNYDYNGEDTL